MKKSKVEFLYDDDGNKSRVILSAKDFEELIDELADLRSVIVAYKRTKSKNLKLIPFEKIKKDLGLYDDKEISSN